MGGINMGDRSKVLTGAIRAGRKGLKRLDNLQENP